MKVYLSGPISGISDHVGNFSRAADEVQGKGHEPLDPHDIPVFPHKGDCPDGARNGDDDPHTWPCYLRADLVYMLQCDALLMLQGHESSRGAIFERQVAEGCGMPVYLSIEELS